MADTQTVLLQVTGPDRPGIVALLLKILATAGARIADVEQIVIRGNISLSLVVDIPPGQDVLKDVLLYGWEHSLQVDFEVVTSTPTPRQSGWVVTVMGANLNAAELHTVAAATADSGANIDRIERLSRYPVWSYQLNVSGGDGVALRNNLMHMSSLTPGLDVAIQADGLGRRSQRLVVLDVDSTLIQNEVIDLIADVAGVGTEVAAITESAMRGELDFGQSLNARVQLLAGQPVEILDRAWDRLTLTPGARTFVRTLKSLGFSVAIVSGGFTFFTDRLKAELGLDYAYANTLETRRGVLTGRVTGRVVDKQMKATLLRQIAVEEGVELSQTVAVGDGANDLAMLDIAGLGIAFNAKPIVQEAADTSVSVPYLDAILFVLGVRREDMESAGLSNSDTPVADSLSRCP